MNPRVPKCNRRRHLARRVARWGGVDVPSVLEASAEQHLTLLTMLGDRLDLERTRRGRRVLARFCTALVELVRLSPDREVPRA